MRDIPEDNIPALESLPGEDSTLKEDTPDSTFTDDSSLNEHTQKQHLPKQPKEGTQKGDTPQDQGSGVSAEQPEIVYRKFAGRIGEKTWFVTFPCAKAPKRKTPDPDESVTETESEREDFDPWLWFGAWNKPSSLENEPEASCGPSGDGSDELIGPCPSIVWLMFASWRVAPRSGTCPSGGYMAGT
ncbi:hypothetical protein BDN67DRAFT_965059 [Paxillus ammoniavirescens]|nr:hypothetical protein BDN67DRAFT_965059 [Paxillus ammoniavirescens]